MLANTLSEKEVKKKRKKRLNSTTSIKFDSPLQKSWQFMTFIQVTALKSKLLRAYFKATKNSKYCNVDTVLNLRIF